MCLIRFCIALSKIIDELIEICELGDLIKKLPQGLDTIIGELGTKLSGGERQRAAFIRAIINKPSLVLMDEPTGNLDQENSKKLQELIISIMHEQDSIFLVATHDKDFADRADQIIAL